MATQRLRVLTGVHREHLLEQGGRRPVSQQSTELRLQLIQLRGRAGIRRPGHACLGRAAAGAAEAGQPHPDLAEQRGDRMLAIVLHPAGGAAAPARRTVHGMNPGLRGDDLPLDASQHQPRIGQGQTQISDIVEAIGPADFHDLRTPLLAFRPDFYQPQNPSHAPTLGQRTDADIPDRRRTPNLATVPIGRSDSMDSITLQTGFQDLQKRAYTEYHQSLAEILSDPDLERSCTKLGRLVAVVIMVPFAKAQTLTTPSEWTRAYQTWQLQPVSVTGDLTNTWQYKLIDVVRHD